MRERNDPLWEPLPDLAAAMITARNLNEILHTHYTPQEILAMDDEELLCLREGVSVLGAVIEWETEKARKQHGR